MVDEPSHSSAIANSTEYLSIFTIKKELLCIPLDGMI